MDTFIEGVMNSHGEFLKKARKGGYKEDREQVARRKHGEKEG